MGAAAGLAVEADDLDDADAAVRRRRRRHRFRADQPVLVMGGAQRHVVVAHRQPLADGVVDRRLQRALRLGLRTAGDLMVPVSKLTMLRLDTPWQDVVRVVASSPFSRLPVYRTRPQDIIGTLRVKDLVYRYVVDGEGSPLESLVRPIVRVPQTLPADRVIGLLRERRVHQAVVTDSADEIVGLVTIQDVIGAFLDPASTRVDPASRRVEDAHR